MYVFALATGGDSLEQTTYNCYQCKSVYKHNWEPVISLTDGCVYSVLE